MTRFTIIRCDICKKEQKFDGDIIPDTSSEALIEKMGRTEKEVCKTCGDKVAKWIANGMKDEVKYSDLAPSASAQFTKQYCMTSKEGLVISDVDNVPYNHKTEDITLIEHKSGGRSYFNTFGQFSVYKKLDHALRHTYGSHYKGAFIQWTDVYNQDLAKKFKINGIPASKQQFIDLINLKSTAFEPLDFRKYDPL